MIKLKGLLTEELTKFPGEMEVKKVLSGYEQYSHGPNEIGFFGKGASVKVLDAILKKFYDRSGSNPQKVMGFLKWGYQAPASPYHSYWVSFDSSDGKTVRNFSASIIKE